MMPVIIQDDISIGANATVENVIAQNTGAQRYIRAPFNAIGTLLLAQSATGLRAELVLDGETILDSSDLNIATVLNVPDSLVVEQFSIRQGGQLVLRLVNTTAGALVCHYRITMAETAQFMPRQRVTLRGPISIAANTTVQLLTGTRFERALIDSYLNIFGAASAAGLLLEVFVNGISVAPALPVKTSNRIPINPYDQLLDGIECPQDTLIELRVQNTTAGALNLFWMTQLQEANFRNG